MFQGAHKILELIYLVLFFGGQVTLIPETAVLNFLLVFEKALRYASRNTEP